MESAKTDKEGEAKKLLKLREGQVQEGRFPGLQVNRTRLSDLANGLLTSYQLKDRKSTARAEISTNHLKAFFGDCRATDITTSRIEQYITARRADGAANATINRELAALKRMFALGMRHTPPLVLNAPYFEMLKEDNARTGFFSYEEYTVILDNLPKYMKGPFTVAYFTGMRREEILSLQWSQVNLFDRTITLDPGTTKNGEGRVVYLAGELLDVIRLAHQDKNGPYVFHRGGEKIGSFRKVWVSAFKKAGIEEKLFHDLRRTAVRNMVRAGVSETVAMRISGHKTRSIFDRYNVTDGEDLRVAAERVSMRHEEHRAAREDQGYNLVTIGQKG
jgi:integrase